MGNFNSSGFQYNGRRYNFTAIISWSDDPNDSTALDNNHIDGFVYANEINTLFLNGYVEYTDTTGLVDKILDKQYAYCEISFYEFEAKMDKTITVEIPSKTLVLLHKFYVNSIDVLDRQENLIRYRLNLISMNWFKCISNVVYSNYNTEKKDIVDIIKAILTYSGLTVNEDTFGIVKSGLKMNFITDTNDNAITSIGYLLNKMYYYHDRSEQFQFLIYNEHTDKFEMFDVLNNLTWFALFPLAVTFFKNLVEQLSLAENANFATVTKFPRSALHSMMNNVKYYDYDLTKNYITDEAIGSKTILQYYNNFVNVGDAYLKNLTGLYKLTTQELTYDRYSTYWNNTNLNLGINLYDEMKNNLTQGNSLVVNTGGNILRKPGCILEISLDRSMSNATGDRHEDTKKLQDAYKAYEGRWFITKVQTFLNLRQMRYALNLICCRNFLKK